MNAFSEIALLMASLMRILTMALQDINIFLAIILLFAIITVIVFLINIIYKKFFKNSIVKENIEK